LSVVGNFYQKSLDHVPRDELVYRARHHLEAEAACRDFASGHAVG
jgi:hypothetical protein